MTEDLTLALLALDSYNRNYLRGVFTAPGGAGDDNPGVQIGDVTILRSFADTATSFYAIAYDMGGTTGIAYRGTDDLAGDLLTGWTLGAGFAAASQATEAIQFYQSVTNRSVFNGPAPDVILTGHSLGGGLAGSSRL
jgi:Protein of unknown function (DUF2974)